jgi:hypothetical protein
VLPLNDPATASVGKDGVGLATYQELVHRRYADKLPGSAYQREHRLGGYDTSPPAPENQTLPAILLIVTGVGTAPAGVVDRGGPLAQGPPRSGQYGQPGTFSLTLYSAKFPVLPPCDGVPDVM